jgi:sorbitol-specific phosphotransferase system component IIA
MSNQLVLQPENQHSKIKNDPMENINVVEVITDAVKQTLKEMGHVNMALLSSGCKKNLKIDTVL